MTIDLAAAMRRAFDQTRAGNLAGATQSIQSALAGEAAPQTEAETGPVIDHVPAEAPRGSGSQPGRARHRLPLGDAVSLLRAGRPGFDAGGAAGKRTVPVPGGARFESRSFDCASGSRDYRLYVPSAEQPRGLIVMLHGCTQSPDDFAIGTRMNDAAERHGLVVVYPAQPQRANQQGCWNWFNPGDQLRDRGEPAIIAGIARVVAAEHGAEQGRIFVAGLSAGGAMAAILAETYPDVFSGAGIHSGLPTGSASDVASAFAAMRGQTTRVARPDRPVAQGANAARLIVIHGEADRTVDASNGRRIADAARARLGGREKTVSGTAGGRAYQRLIVDDSAGRPALEHWSIAGAGHAWSGGNAAGSHADPKGPDASAEMVRFFLDA